MQNEAVQLNVRRIVVAMSGGVDSSVAALMLQREGHDVIGVSMQVWDYRNHGGSASRATCCAPRDFADARRVAQRVGVPYYVFDFEEQFGREVIERFVAEYRVGRTPNPCVECNQRVKFRELRKRAQGIGYPTVATGHYAIIQKGPEGWELRRAVDKQKDQSYFLYGLLPSELPETLFPLGELTKSEVREIAREAGLVTAEKAESQDICFVSGRVADFVAKRGGAAQPGEIVNARGEQLGRHDGIHHFTVGQRRGLRVGGQENPLYVLQIDGEAGRVVVGEREELERESFEVAEVNWLVPPERVLLNEMGCIAQMRYRHAGVPVRVEASEREGCYRVIFLERGSAVSPGQSCVFFDKENERVLGGGKIL